MNKIKILLVVVVLVFVAGITTTAEAANNDKRIADLEASLKVMQTELAQLKTQQVPVDQKKLDTMVSKMLEEKKADMKLVPNWVETFKFKGDLRYRHEWADNEAGNTADRNRHMIRARFGFDAKVNDEVDVGFRLSTGGNTNPASRNQTLDNSFSSKGIYLDLAYADYHPAAIENLHIVGGKMNNPFFKTGSNELMFDADLTPEGGAIIYKRKLSENLTGFGTLGAFYLEERTNDDGDTSMWAAQAGVKYDVPGAEKTYVKAGAGFYDYGNIENFSLANGSALGNTLDGSNNYANDFDIVQVFGEVGFPIGDLPGKVFAEYIDNTGASSKSTGYIIGTSIGKCKKPGNWQFTYSYRDVQADATVGFLNDGTFANGETDSKGHTISLGYQLAKNLKLCGTYAMAERAVSTSSSSDHDAALIDLVFKF